MVPACQLVAIDEPGMAGPALLTKTIGRRPEIPSVRNVIVVAVPSVSLSRPLGERTCTVWAALWVAVAVLPSKPRLMRPPLLPGSNANTEDGSPASIPGDVGCK